MTTHHAPSCLLARVADLVDEAAQLLDHVTDDIEGSVSESAYHEACCVMSALQVMRNALHRLAEEEQDDEVTCSDDEDGTTDDKAVN